VRFWVLTVASMKMAVFWIVAPTQKTTIFRDNVYGVTGLFPTACLLVQEMVCCTIFKHVYTEIYFSSGELEPFHTVRKV
jgi:hypothetical protein